MLVPRDKPSCWPALSLVRVRRSCAGGRSRPASQPSKEGNDRSRAALGPRSTAGRTSRLDRFPHPSDGASRPTAPARGAHNHSPSLNLSLARGRGARQVSKGKPLLSPRAAPGRADANGQRRTPAAPSAAPSPPREGSHPPKGAPPECTPEVMLRTAFRVQHPAAPHALLMVAAAARRQGPRRFHGLRRRSWRLSPCDRVL